ncbi:unnamed protein product [marine sediment metagenome]|uniref:Uncharacterized protein n=1 Tax=marine sediment metagenome TaxID=412755 RepID=X1FHR2_9ZZZZ
MSTMAYILKGNRDEEASVDRFLKREGIVVVNKKTSMGRLYIREEETRERR